MFKSAKALTRASLVALLVVTFTACTTKSEEVPEPEPEPKKTEYLLQTISVKDKSRLDSFVYKNDRITEKWSFDRKYGFTLIDKYTYDNEGRVIRGDFSREGEPEYIDSLAWNATKATKYRKMWVANRNAWVPTDTLIYTIDAGGKLIKFAYADTILLFSNRAYRYTEFTFNSSNNVSQSHYSGYSENNPVYNSYQTMEYGSYDSPLAPYLSKNPLLADRMANIYGNYILSYHNVTKLTWDDEVYLTATTVPAEGTNNIGVLSRNRGGGDIDNYEYGYIRKP